MSLTDDDGDGVAVMVLSLSDSVTYVAASMRFIAGLDASTFTDTANSYRPGWNSDMANGLHFSHDDTSHSSDSLAVLVSEHLEHG